MHAVELPGTEALLSAQAGAKGNGKARVAAAARKLGIRLWIMLRDQIDYKSSAVADRQRVEAHAGMPDHNSGPELQ